MVWVLFINHFIGGQLILPTKTTSTNKVYWITLNHYSICDTVFRLHGCSDKIQLRNRVQRRKTKLQVNVYEEEGLSQGGTKNKCSNQHLRLKLMIIINQYNIVFYQYI